jgi:hypothetical protein
MGQHARLFIVSGHASSLPQSLNAMDNLKSDELIGEFA